MTTTKLFHRDPWQREARASQIRVLQRLSEITDQELLSRNPCEIANDVRHECQPGFWLDFDKIYVRVARGRGVSRIQARIPFKGDTRMLHIRPTKGLDQDLQGKITKNSLVLEVSSGVVSRESLWALIGEKIKLANEYYDALLDDFCPFREDLDGLAYKWIIHRINMAEAQNAA